MDHFVRWIAFFANIAFWILFAFGIILPWVVSTDKLPLTVLLMMGFVLVILFSISLYWTTRIIITKRQIKKLKKLINDSK